MFLFSFSSYIIRSVPQEILRGQLGTEGISYLQNLSWIWRKKGKDEGNIHSHHWHLTRTILAPAAHVQCVHHNLSQGSTGHVLQTDGSLIKQQRPQWIRVTPYVTFGKVKRQWISDAVSDLWYILSWPLDGAVRSDRVRRRRRPCCAAGAANWGHPKVSPPAETDVFFRCPSPPPWLYLLRTNEKQEGASNKMLQCNFE